MLTRIFEFWFSLLFATITSGVLPSTGGTPQVDGSAPQIPTSAAQAQAPPPALGPAPPTSGATQTTAPPPPKRSKHPRGPAPSSDGFDNSPGIPALLAISAASPMFTVQRRSVNYVTPDLTFFFYVASLCDANMNSTHRFTQSNPQWLPIVSQLYLSTLVWYHILRVYVASGYGSSNANYLRQLEEVLRLDECPIPGPLVPFFSSLAASSGPFDWIGDIVSAVPNYDVLWDSANFVPQRNVLPHLPFPVVMLDQLSYFSTWPIPAQSNIYTGFEWYRNVFQLPSSANNARLRSLMFGPQAAGSLFTTSSQAESARNHWNYFFTQKPHRPNAGAAPAFTNIIQLMGFQDQAGNQQTDWFSYVSSVMANYCKYFKGSTTLKSISPLGLGSMEVTGTVANNAAARNWLYPAVGTGPAPFNSSRFLPVHDIPTGLAIDFAHADHDLEEVAEQYQTLCSTNLSFVNVATQHGHVAYTDANVKQGEYWQLLTHRHLAKINFKAQYAQILSSRYHSSTELKTN